MSSVAVSKRIAALTAEFEALLAESVDGSAAEQTAALFAWETFVRRLPAMTHRMVASLGQVPVDELGESSVASALSTLVRISKAEANRRIKEARDLGPRSSITGELLEPELPRTAAAQWRGDISAEHVKIIRRFFKKLPGFVDYATREAAEAQLAELACGLGPEDLRVAADHLALLLDQDGVLSDADLQAQLPDQGQTTSRRHDRDPRPRRPRTRSAAGCGVRQVGRTGHVQPRRRKPLCRRPTQPAGTRR
jgi:hypothetical protein